MDIVSAILLVGVIGLVVAVVLVIASTVMAVPVDEKAKRLEEALPGANCGACGYSGCSGYAKALSTGDARVGLCSPGGDEVAMELSKILGVDAVKADKRVAIVLCRGNNEASERKTEYTGIKSCASAMQVYNGATSCSYGCIGYGDCAAACSKNAIKICSSRAVVDQNRCMGCGECANACPKHLISIVPVKKRAVVLCSSCDKGADTRKACTAGCIACKKCVKACEQGAIEIVDFKAQIDPEKCTGCGRCVDECNFSCILMING